MNSIIQIFESKENIKEKLLENIPDSKAIFEYIEYVFSNPVDNIENLNTLYKILNQNNITLLKNVKNSDDISIVDYYKSMEEQIENSDLKTHITNYIKSSNLSSNIFSLLQKPDNNGHKRKPTINELLERIEKLEKTVEELKIRISNENLLTQGTTPQES